MSLLFLGSQMLPGFLLPWDEFLLTRPTLRVYADSFTGCAGGQAIATVLVSGALS